LPIGRRTQNDDALVVSLNCCFVGCDRLPLVGGCVACWCDRWWWGGLVVPIVIDVAAGSIGVEDIAAGLRRLAGPGAEHR